MELNLNIKIITIAFLMICLSACTNMAKKDIEDSRPSSRNLMLGTFFGEHTTSEGIYRPWIIQRYKNGEYKAIFREFSDKENYKDTV